MNASLPLFPRLRAALCVVFTAALLSATRETDAHGEVSEAIAALTLQIEQDPVNGELHFRRAEMHRAHRDWPQALADYDLASVFAPDLSFVEIGRGEALREQGNFEEARKAFASFVQRRPDDAVGYAALARLALQQGDAAGAAADYGRAIERTTPASPELFLAQARAFATAGRPGDALNAIGRGIAELGPVAALLAPAVEIARDAGDHRAAIAFLDRLVETQPRKCRWQAQRGDLLAAMGRADEARKAYRAALDEIQALPEERRTTEAMQAIARQAEQGLAKIESECSR